MNGSALGRVERLLQDPAPTTAEIFELVADRLDAVEALFRENLASPVRIVREIGTFVAEGGGKRVRPTLHLLAADLAGLAYFEFLFWGGGHVLQFTHTLLMMLAWVLLASASGCRFTLSPRMTTSFLFILALPVVTVP